MKYRDLRDFLGQLEGLGELRKLAEPVSPRLEMTAIGDKLLRAAAMGAEAGFDHSRDDVAAAVKSHLGRGVDVVLDSVGEATWPRSLKALRPGGRLVTCGATSGHDVAIDLRRLFWFQWSLLGSSMSTSGEFAEVVALGNAGKLRPPIDTVFPLAQGAEAYQRLASGQQFGKLVLEVTS